MKNIIYTIAILFLFSSCEKVLMEKEPTDDPINNFEYLWNTTNEKYSFFEYKGIDWNSVYHEYRAQIYPEMKQGELFYVLADMMNELQDGHVNLTAPFDYSRYLFKYDAPENFNFRLLQDNYIGWEYRVTGSLINTSFERNGQEIGYIYYGSFSRPIQSADIDFAVQSLYHTKGIILDLRSNGGGSVNNIYRLGSRFADEKRFIYSSLLKNGPGHDDFSDPADVYMEPGGAYQYLKPVILLTNRGCFSATSFFTLAMKAFPRVIQVGDTTGGGLGSPAGYELPNGWSYRFSVSRTLSPDGENFENGIPPDIAVWMDPENELIGVDDIMEKAIELILNEE